MKEFPLLVPQFPSRRSVSRYLELSYKARQFSNFGPCHNLLRERLSAILGISESSITLTSSGTAALWLSLMVVKQQSEVDEVLVPDWNFPAIVGAATAAGLRATPISNDLSTGSLDAGELVDLITPSSCVADVAPFGDAQPAVETLESCNAANPRTPVVVDAAAALPELLRRTSLINLRAWWAISLHATKAVPAGEGGFLIHQEENAEVCQRLTNFGFFNDRRSIGPGLNLKMSETSAAVALASLDEFDSRQERRELERELWAEGFASVGVQMFPGSQVCASTTMNVKFSSANQASEFKSRMSDEGIPTRVWWPTLMSEKVGLSPHASSMHLRDVVVGVPFGLRQILGKRSFQGLYDSVLACGRDSISIGEANE